ncbi:cytochrome b/b6 domain-containing protein [Sulfitobacter sp. LCG007]
MRRIKVWDPVVRVFHWSLVLAFGVNALVIDDDTKLHQWIGWTVLILVGCRILWGFVGSDHARFSDFPPSFADSLDQLSEMASGRRTVHLGHTPLGAFMIYNLILSLLVVCLSGWLMTTDAFWGEEWPEALHELAVHWVELSVLAHVLAVVFESRRLRINLPRAMVTGYKDMPDP